MNNPDFTTIHGEFNELIEFYSITPKTVDCNKIDFFHKRFGHSEIFEKMKEPYEFDYSYLKQAFDNQNVYLKNLVLTITNQLKARDPVIYNYKADREINGLKVNGGSVESSRVYNDSHRERDYSEAVLEVFYTLSKFIINHSKEYLAFLHQYLNYFGTSHEAIEAHKGRRFVDLSAGPAINKDLAMAWVNLLSQRTIEFLFEVCQILTLESILELKYSIEFTHLVGCDYDRFKTLEKERASKQPMAPQQPAQQPPPQKPRFTTTTTTTSLDDSQSAIMDYNRNSPNSNSDTPKMMSEPNDQVMANYDIDDDDSDSYRSNILALSNGSFGLHQSQNGTNLNGSASPSSAMMQSAADLPAVVGDPTNAGYDTWPHCKVFLPDLVKVKQTSIQFYIKSQAQQYSVANINRNTNKKDGKKIQSNFLKRDEYNELKTIFHPEDLVKAANSEGNLLPSQSNRMLLFNTRFQPFPREASTARYLTCSPVIVLTDLKLTDVTFECKVDPPKCFRYDKFEYDYCGVGVYRFDVSVSRINVEQKKFRLCISLYEKHKFVDSIWTPYLSYCNTTSEFEHPECNTIELKDNIFNVLGNSFKEGKAGGKPLKVEFTHCTENMQPIYVSDITRIKVFWIQFQNPLKVHGKYKVRLFYERSKYPMPPHQLIYDYQQGNQISL